MRFLTLAMTSATAAFLMTGGIASAQTKAAPEKAQGAGAECARTTAPGSRDECVHQQKNGASSSTRNNASGSSGATGAESSGSGQSGTAAGRQDNSQGNMPGGTMSGSRNSTSGSSGMPGGADRDRSKR